MTSRAATGNAPVSFTSAVSTSGSSKRLDLSSSERARYASLIPAHHIDWLICETCGYQYHLTRADLQAAEDKGQEEKSIYGEGVRGWKQGDCVVCRDDRQPFPPSGQRWTTLREMTSPSPSPGDAKYTNKLWRDEENDRVWFLQTEPAFGIGQRAILLVTEEGVVMWDCISYIDAETLALLDRTFSPFGGIVAICISHPHFYSSHLTYARALSALNTLNDMQHGGHGRGKAECNVWVSEADKEWLQRGWPGGWLGEEEPEWTVRVKEEAREVCKGVILIRVEGHFAGSSVLYWDRNSSTAADSNGKDNAKERTNGTDGGLLCTADSIMISPDGSGASFMWSVPMLIPLSPHSISLILSRVSPYPFTDVLGGWPGRELRASRFSVVSGSPKDVKWRKASGFVFDASSPTTEVKEAVKRLVGEDEKDWSLVKRRIWECARFVIAKELGI